MSMYVTLTDMDISKKKNSKKVHLSQLKCIPYKKNTVYIYEFLCVSMFMKGDKYVVFAEYMPTFAIYLWQL